MPIGTTSENQIGSLHQIAAREPSSSNQVYINNITGGPATMSPPLISDMAGVPKILIENCSNCEIHVQIHNK